MAKKEKAAVDTWTKKPKVRRPGVYAKTRTSRVKGSKNYVKPYRGQGR